MDAAAVCSKAVVLVLLIHCLLLLPLFVFFCVFNPCLIAVSSVLSSFSTISLKKRKLVALGGTIIFIYKIQYTRIQDTIIFI